MGFCCIIDFFVVLGIMESHYTYIIYSEFSRIYYKGYSTDPYSRLLQHNNKESRYTRNKGPWELVYIEMHNSKREALIAEKKLKKSGSYYLQKLILSDRNLLGRNTDLSSRL
jgi:putative endonuclease